ncbi:hypothetical protein ACVI1L_000471 [Bradyrhizobium sp. USDA 4516]
MFGELRYRWELRKYLKTQHKLYRAYDQLPVDDEDADESPRRGKKWELIYQTQATDYFRSKYLIEKAYKLHIPIPQDEESWIQPRGAPERFLTTAAANKLHSEIRAMQKVEYEYWQSRVTLFISVIALAVAILAYFKK